MSLFADECAAGYVIDFATENCVPCPKDTYQKENLRGQCDVCPKDKGTFNTATVSASACYCKFTIKHFSLEIFA